MSKYERIAKSLAMEPKTWAITGVAGFIGSNLLEALLKLNQRVIGLDNFETGFHSNLDEVRSLVSPDQWSRFDFKEGDVRNLEDCRIVSADVDYVLHQAALGSVPRSLKDPLATNAANVTGFLNMLVAARDAGVKRFIYAASSSTYGDHTALPKTEERIGAPLSPYAVTKYVNELYAAVFGRCYDFKSIGLRYFNVFGPRQHPDGAYAAVIPRWTAAMMRGKSVFVNGDGMTSRDFCFVDNVVQANVLAATVVNDAALNQIFNVGVGEQTTLNELFDELKRLLTPYFPTLHTLSPTYREPRPGDVRHSRASIDKAKRLLEFSPTHGFSDGLAITVRQLMSGRSCE